MSTPRTTSGIGFLGLLTLIFITLKLCGVIAWSWWWVLAPLWGPPAIALTVFAGMFVIGGISVALSIWLHRK